MMSVTVCDEVPYSFECATPSWIIGRQRLRVTYSVQPFGTDGPKFVFGQLYTPTNPLAVTIPNSVSSETELARREPGMVADTVKFRVPRSVLAMMPKDRKSVV